MRRRPLIATGSALGAILALGACAVQPPTGPTVMALPPQGKSLAAFQQDDISCRGYAQQQTGYPQPGLAGNPALGGAAIGTAVGAAAGAALGAIAGNPGAGAAIGGGTGLLGGTAIGANTAGASQYSLQQRYNIAYTQCMYARGNSVQSAPPGYAAGGYPGYPYPSAWGYPYSVLARFVLLARLLGLRLRDRLRRRLWLWSLRLRSLWLWSLWLWWLAWRRLARRRRAWRRRTSLSLRRGHLSQHRSRDRPRNSPTRCEPRFVEPRRSLAHSCWRAR